MKAIDILYALLYMTGRRLSIGLLLINAMLEYAPLVPVALGLCAGILTDQSLRPSHWVYVSGFATVFLISLIPRRIVRQRHGHQLTVILSLFVGGMLHAIHARMVPGHGIERWAAADEPGRIVRLRGRVVSRPELMPKPQHAFSRWTYGTDRTAFLCEVESLEGRDGRLIAAEGRIRVRVDDTLLHLREHEQVELFGRLKQLSPPRNPGTFDWSQYLRRQGIQADLLCKHRQNVRRLEAQPAPSAGGLLRWLRDKSRSLLTDDLASGTSEERSLLEAMVLGHRSRFDRKLNDIFVRSGCLHFLAASGANVAVLIAFLWFLARLFRQPQRRCAWLMLAASVFYALLADPRPPILRAAVMVAVFCLAYLWRRTTVHLNTIAAAAVVLLLVHPQMLFDLGFQLSFAAVFGVVYVAPALFHAVQQWRDWAERVLLSRPCAAEDHRIRRAVARDRGWWPRVRIQSAYALSYGLAVTFGAWLTSLPIVAVHFQRFQTWGALSTLLVYPLFSVVMILGFVKLFATAVSPSLGLVVGFPLAWLDTFLLTCVRLLASLPAAQVELPGRPPPVVALGYGLVLLLFTWRFYRRSLPDNGIELQETLRRRKVPRTPQGLSVVLAASAVLLAAACGVWLWPRSPEPRLRATILSVGRGSATVLELPNGQSLLYDLGTSYPWDVGTGVILPFLKDRGIRYLERIYISHANLDHFSGMHSVLDGMPTGPVVLNRCFERAGIRESSPARHLVNILCRRQHPVEWLESAPRKWDDDTGVTFEVLWPRDCKNLPDTWSANDTSTVLRLTYAGRSLLLTGDIEEAAQRALIERGDLHADVLVLPHHGGVATTLPTFLAAVAPQAVIRSHHERTAETINGLPEVVGDIPCYNTADVGAVRVEWDSNGVQVHPFMD